MVGAGLKGEQDILARVSIVNFYGNVLLDTFVYPSERITDWRTKYSGIRSTDVLTDEGKNHFLPILIPAKSFEEAQSQVMKLIKDRILIGHALKGDLAVLKLSHPYHAIRDTSSYEPFRRKYNSGRPASLEKIVKGELGVTIQSGEHDSVWHFHRVSLI